MLRRFKCPKCRGKGDIKEPPAGPYDEWTSKTCQACDGNGYIEVDDEDEIKE